MSEKLVNQAVDVPAPPQAVHHQLMSISGADSYAPIQVTPTGITLVRKRTPVWAICVAVFLFPLGLFALFAKEEHTVGIGLEPLPGGTRVTVYGEASLALLSGIDYVLQGYRATPAGLPQGYYAPAGPPMGAPPPPPPPPR